MQFSMQATSRVHANSEFWEQNGRCRPYSNCMKVDGFSALSITSKMNGVQHGNQDLANGCTAGKFQHPNCG